MKEAEEETQEERKVVVMVAVDESPASRKAMQRALSVVRGDNWTREAPFPGIELHTEDENPLEKEEKREKKDQENEKYKFIVLHCCEHFSEHPIGNAGVEERLVTSQNLLLEEKSRAFLTRLERDELVNSGVDYEMILSIGDPRREIVREVKDNHVDLLFVGCRGVSVLQRLLVGSTSRYCILHCPCSVMVVK
eukprot:CAMPEP_0174249970 /NCGR_PEP_ID=MMETSP0439-20130205/284_1 /TAXON_ID=0 /ORGANISM="Stereomyxa ramosa, Strain Chinc5" /LENGTH=192 /DNA_ID=CAMNT_0015329919 /DNA_START=3 /DNA_END=581 /DNA_ORIENTATION=-